MSLNQLSSEHQAIIQTLVEEMERIFGERLKAVLLKGSILRDDQFIPGYSDLDLHLYVSDELLIGQTGGLSLEWTLKVQEAVGIYEPEKVGFSQFQLNFLSADHYPADWTPSHPLNSVVIFGDYKYHPPLPEEKLRRNALNYLNNAGKWRDSLLTSFLDKSNEAAPRVVRLGGTYLKGALWSLALAIWDEPDEVWNTPFNEILSHVSNAIFPQQAGETPLQAYFSHIRDWERFKTAPSYQRLRFREVILCLDAIEDWVKTQGE